MPDFLMNPLPKSVQILRLFKERKSKEEGPRELSLLLLHATTLFFFFFIFFFYKDNLIRVNNQSAPALQSFVFRKKLARRKKEFRCPCSPYVLVHHMKGFSTYYHSVVPEAPIRPGDSSLPVMPCLWSK